MMEPRLKEYLLQIDQASADAIRYTVGMTYAEFLTDTKTQMAVAMCLVIIGEAAKKIGDKFPSFCDLHPEIKWPYMRGLRNRIAHDYFDLDFQVIWETATIELLNLRDSIAGIKDSD